MKRNARNYFRRDGPFIECELSRTDTYSDVVEKICSYFKVAEASTSLYRPHNGTIIPSTELTVNNKSVIWTLGSYMRVRHLGPENLQIGISSTASEEPAESASGSHSSDGGVHHIINNYSYTFLTADNATPTRKRFKTAGKAIH